MSLCREAPFGGRAAHRRGRALQVAQRVYEVQRAAERLLYQGAAACAPAPSRPGSARARCQSCAALARPRRQRWSTPAPTPGSCSPRRGAPPARQSRCPAAARPARPFACPRPGTARAGCAPAGAAAARHPLQPPCVVGGQRQAQPTCALSTASTDARTPSAAALCPAAAAAARPACSASAAGPPSTDAWLSSAGSHAFQRIWQSGSYGQPADYVSARGTLLRAR